MGYSFGGYYAARVAAFEKRYAAGVAFAALHWDLAAWQREIKRQPRERPEEHRAVDLPLPLDHGLHRRRDAAIEKAEQLLAGRRRARRSPCRS